MIGKVNSDWTNGSHQVSKVYSALKQFGLWLVIMIGLLELSSFLYIKYINPNIPLPTYSMVNAGSKFWVEIDEHFGVWHKPGSSYLHNKSCFVVKYQANAMGMRDKERSLASSSPRVAILGDSFIEGWGNASPDRLSDRLEKALGTEVLNFGTSGGFGTVQEWLQYKHFVSRFSHDVVILGVLPHNDFNDNSYAMAVQQKSTAYRPYLVGQYPDYKLVYTANHLPDYNKGTPWLKSFDFTLREWSSFYRLMRYLGSFRIRNYKLVPHWQAEFDDTGKPDHSYYYDFAEADWQVMRYTIEQLVAEAKGKKVIVFTIPVHSDFLRYKGEEPPLSEKLRQLSEQKNFVYVDMLKEMSQRGLNAHDLFFVCDNHWGAFGNEVAAGILLPHVEKALKK